MAVQAKFIADFQSFYDAVEKAEVSLKSFEADSVKVEQQINRMADSLSGRHMIQQASLMSEAISEIGGVSKLSTEEASRSLRTLEQAFDKMLRTGDQIPTSMMKQAAELRRVVSASNQADAAVMSISANYRQFDGILQALGINIGPYVKGLEDITSLVSGGIGGMGLFGAAAAVVGTALGSWKLGQHIGEVTGWTEAIARGTAVARGYGDVQQETALAVADANDLSLVYEQNLKRQQQSVEASTKAAKDHSDELQRNWMITDGNKDALARLQEQLDATAEKRHQDAVATFQASQAESAFTDAINAQTSALDARAAAAAANGTSYAPTSYTSSGSRSSNTSSSSGAGTSSETSNQYASETRDQSMQRIADAEAKRKAEIDAFMKAPTLNDREAFTVSGDLPALAGFALDDVISRFHQAGDTTDSMALKRALATLEGQEGRYAPKNNVEYFQMQNDQVLLAQLLQLQGTGKIPGFKDGVENFKGGMAIVGEDGPELVRLPRGASVTPNGRFGGMTNHITINLRGGATRLDGKMISEALIEHLRSSGVRLRSGLW